MLLLFDDCVGVNKRGRGLYMLILVILLDFFLFLDNMIVCGFVGIGG